MTIYEQIATKVQEKYPTRLITVRAHIDEHSNTQFNLVCDGILTEYTYVPEVMNSLRQQGMSEEEIAVFFAQSVSGLEFVRASYDR